MPGQFFCTPYEVHAKGLVQNFNIHIHIPITWKFELKFFLLTYANFCKITDLRFSDMRQRFNLVWLHCTRYERIKNGSICQTHSHVCNGRHECIVRATPTQVCLVPRGYLVKVMVAAGGTIAANRRWGVSKR